MDHLLANSDNPIPAAGEADSSASGSAGAGGGVDGDEDDDEALKMHIKKTGASDEPVANVRRLHRSQSIPLRLHGGKRELGKRRAGARARGEDLAMFVRG